jgi:hypothetical protein
MANGYTDTTDTNFKEEPYNIDTGKPLSATGMREALHTKEAVLPVGTILAMSASSWVNASADFKSKWKVCDGTSGTPNLRGRFLRGGTSSDAATGGADSQSFSIGAGNLPNHTHTFTGNTASGSIDANPNGNCQSAFEAVSSASGVFSNSTFETRTSFGDIGSVGPSIKSLKFSMTPSGTVTGGGSASPAPLTVNIVPSYYTVIYIIKV